MINTFRLIILILTFYQCYELRVAFSLPVYTNYSNTDILTTKFKIGSLIGKTEANDIDFNIYEEGLSLLFEFNPLYHFPYINNFYLGFNFDSFFNKDFRTNEALLSLSYNIPIVITSLDMIPNINLYITNSFGIKYISGNDNNLIISNICKYSSAEGLALGAEIYFNSLKDYKIAFYLEFKNTYSKYNIIINNNKNCKQYRNSFVTIGLLYRTRYLINGE